MKYAIYTFTVLILVLFSSCKEELPVRVVETTLKDTTYIATSSATPQERKVLIEEFTGASCINCPAGHEVLKQIKVTYGNKINIISLHHGGLSAPVEPVDQDLRTQEAASIAAEFGSNSMPSALIDRVQLSGKPIVIGRSEWTSLVDSRVPEPVQANISLTSTYNSQLEKYVLGVKIEFVEEYSNDVNYYISLIEDGIAVTQKDGSTHIEDYEQEHTLRKMYTAYNGKSLSKIGVKYEKGRVYEKEIVLDVENKWNLEKVHLVVYIADNATKKVIQSQEISIK